MNFFIIFLLLLNFGSFQEENLILEKKNEVVEEVIKLHKAGLSQDIIFQYIQSYKKPYQVSANDVLNLKENNIPEEIIKKLLQFQSYILKDEVQKKEREFKNLVFKKGIIKKDRAGTLALKDDRLEWYDLKDPSKNFSFKIKNIKTIWLKCKPRTVENFCYEIVFSNYDGRDFSFSDFNWEGGENKVVKEIYDFFKENFKEIIYQEKVK